MKSMTGATYGAQEWERLLMVAQAKEGKTAFTVASVLGMWPGQKCGAVVTTPADLHVITFDMGACGGLSDFLTKACGAPESALGFNIYNCEDDLQAALSSQQEYDRKFYDVVYKTLADVQQKIRAKPNNVSCIIVSSLTLLAHGLERSIGGPPDKDKGAGMDMAKWGRFGYLVNDLRNLGHSGKCHMIWEAHVYKTGGTNGQEPGEQLTISGKTGQNYASNVLMTYRLRRLTGQPIAPTKVDKVQLDTRPTGGFMSGGRGATTALAPIETDLTDVFIKLGRRVGGWRPVEQQKQVA